MAISSRLMASCQGFFLYLRVLGACLLPLEFPSDYCLIYLTEVVVFLLRIGIICPTIGLIHPKLPSRIHCHNWSRFKKHNSIPVAYVKIRNKRTCGLFRKKYALSVGRSHNLASHVDDSDEEPFWSNILKEAFWALKSCLKFLVEQPSQLKYIEWPSFQSTLKTATLTLLLVGLLIVALSSVDYALCYILSLLSRKRA